MKVIVVGGGASGMIAAITSAKQGNETILIEKTASLGNKIKITGKGRCNVTFDGDIEDFRENIKHNNKFMYSSYMNFSNSDRYISPSALKSCIVFRLLSCISFFSALNSSSASSFVNSLLSSTSPARTAKFSLETR